MYSSNVRLLGLIAGIFLSIHECRIVFIESFIVQYCIESYYICISRLSQGIPGHTDKQGEGTRTRDELYKKSGRDKRSASFLNSF
jgi:hypothetical protein